MRYARAYLVTMGVVTMLLGLMYAIAPAVFTDPSGFGSLAPEALTDLRATYGGLQLAVGAYLLWSVGERSRYRAGLVLLGVVFTAVATSRAFGLIVDGEPTAAQLGALAFESVMAIVSWTVVGRATRVAG